MSDRLLLVLTGDRQVGLSVEPLVEVRDLGQPFPVPAATAAMRGVIEVRRRMLPVFHLGVALEGGTCPDRLGQMAVVAEVAGRALCLEVDYASEVTRETIRPWSDEDILPGAVGVVERAGIYVPIIDLTVLGPQLLDSGNAR